ncbi:MAG: single-stranded-DNA-specific exonuclease RecJ [Clostridiaceae bacterium]|jgi:single-stranded-DNA-specific exonuclease|nr:single-stranded-DNA-specific exonuclease RecJ [Clostridiaceae bacterium]
MENYYLGNARRWKCAEKDIDDTALENPYKDSIPETIFTLLNKRGICTKREIDAFFKPSLNNLHDPFLLDGMEAAVKRILLAVRNKERVLIYGDYDADGVSATSILIRFLGYLNVDVDFYIPDRVDEGYGISEQAIDYISNESYNLVITVDCGISGRSQIEAINSKASENNRRIDFIITDHHQCNQQLIPDAIAIINPHLPNSKYPFKNLCGAGVALKLIQALCSRLDIPGKYEEYLDIVAIATVADIVELKDENRIFTKLGMDKILNNPCPGIKALLDVSLRDKSRLNAYVLSFLLAPRINAAGRMGDAGVAVELFTSDDLEQAYKLVDVLNNSNTKRQTVQEQIFTEALSIIENDPRYRDEKVIVVHNQGWHHGVIGIVASKIVELYHKPTFVFSVENGTAVGSARSIEGFNLFMAMEANSDLFIKFGGHEQAGGLTLLSDNLSVFRSRINSYAQDLITEEMLIPETCIDIETKGSDINMKTAKAISYMDPFGVGNKKPVFSYRGAIVSSKRAIGDGKHLKLTLQIDQDSIDAVYFGKGALEKGIFPGHKVDIIFTLEVNTFRGNENLQLKIIDMRLTESLVNRNIFLLKASRNLECLDCDKKWLYNGIIDKIIENDDIVVNRDILAVIYKYIVNQGSLNVSVADLFVLAERLGKETNKNLNIFKIIAGLLIFDELGLLEVILSDSGSYTITIPSGVERVSLFDSNILGWLNNVLKSGA